MVQKDDNPSNVLLLLGLLIVGFGVTRLVPMLLGPWWPYIDEYVRWASRLSQPLLFIVIGLMLVYFARRGGFRGGTGRLVRPLHDRKISGVASGFAHYLGIDVTVVRLALILVAVLGGWWFVFLVYFAGSIIIPDGNV